MITRILSGLIGFPLVVVLLIFGNQLVIDISFAIVAIICLYEFYNVFKEKEIKPIKWVRLYFVCFNWFNSCIT